MQAIAVFFLAAAAIGGVVYVFVYPILSGERKAEQRMQSVAKAEPLARAARGSQKSRREAIELTLKEVEERHKKKKSVLLSARIAQAGLSWSKRQFAMISAGIGLGMFIIGLLSGAGLLVATGLGFAGAFGVPRWLLSYLKKRREKKFLEAFPDAVDIIVRGIKTGLPLLDCIKMITAEAPEPLKSEFRVINASHHAAGRGLRQTVRADAAAGGKFLRNCRRDPTEGGGNLSEALGNLSKVLRDRKKMRAKIQAMPQEAKASAAIIGALPIAVMILVYLTSPPLLFTNSLGHLMLAGSAVWMTIGVLVMKKMINFDF